MLLSCCQIRILPVTNSFQCGLYRNCILLSIFDTFHAADCIRMSLTNTLAPESIVLTFRQDCICIKSVQREHTRIPAYRNNADITTFFSCRINILKMFRNSCMCIKAVNDIEHLCIHWCLLWKICCTSSTKNHYINLIFPILHIRNTAYRNILC